MSSKQRSNVPTLPSGTVTFLFTDIEGSTRLWETQRQAMTTALERHDALLRQCIESRGGHVFKTVGDAFCAAFATAASAVDAALADPRPNGAAHGGGGNARRRLLRPAAQPRGAASCGRTRTTLKSLGEHGLKDLAGRETVFQFCHPDLPQAFPPLKTLLAPIDKNMPSIAVLPFADLSAEKDQEYFTDGLAEELLNVLSA
jgi:hypothetical protein